MSGGALIGLDPGAARTVATAWRRIGQRWIEVADAALVDAISLQLDATGIAAIADEVGRGLALGATLLAERADAIERLVWEQRHVSKASVDAGWARLVPWPFGWSWSTAPRDADDGFGASDDPVYADLVEWLSGGPRGEVVAELALPGDGDWASMVDAGTMWEGSRAVRFLDIEPDPGAGIVVVDFFIPGDGSFLLEGDDRPNADAIFGELTAGDSRAVMVFDLEVGRASVQFDETCPMYVPGCQAARAITSTASRWRSASAGCRRSPTRSASTAEGTN